MNFSIIPAAFDFLRKGEALANPGIWKVGGTVLSGAVGAFAFQAGEIAKGLGYDLHITPDVAGAAGIGAAWVVSVFFTAATSKTVGILPAKPGTAGGSPASEQGPLDPQLGGIGADTRKAAEVWVRSQSAIRAENDLRGGP